MNADDWNKLLAGLIARLNAIVRAHSAPPNGAHTHGPAQEAHSGCKRAASDEGANPLPDAELVRRFYEDRIPLEVRRGERDPEVRA